MQLGFTEHDEEGGGVEELLPGAAGNAKTPDASKVFLSCLSAPSHTLPHHPIPLAPNDRNVPCARIFCNTVLEPWDFCVYPDPDFDSRIRAYR